jgi:glycosyltransferase involved in cell wall biosynthesis
VKKICLISEDLGDPLDEGFKKFTSSLAAALSAEYDLLAMSRNGLDKGTCRAEAVAMNRFLLNRGLRRRIRKFAPDIICYVPSSSGTLNSMVRARVLKWYGRDAKIVLISLQPRKFSRCSAWLASRLCPDMMLVQSEESVEYLKRLGCVAHFLPSGVDPDLFAPVSTARKAELRRRHKLPAEAFLLLHVGHINPARGISLFMDLQREPGIQVILVGSTSTPQDEELAHQLEMAGVRVIREYLPGIQEIYQLSDCYLFQVSGKTSAIEIPLSVLEAMACNLPVITTRFGGLRDLFSEGGGLLFAETREQMLDGISQVRSGMKVRTREMVTAISWGAILKTYWQRYLR